VILFFLLPTLALLILWLVIVAIELIGRGEK
jgi:hypothetical protein